MQESPLDIIGNLLGYRQQPQGRPLGERHESLRQDYQVPGKYRPMEEALTRMQGREQEYLGNRIVRDSPLNLKYPGFGFGGGIPLDDYFQIEKLRQFQANKDAENSAYFNPIFPLSPDQRPFDRRPPSMKRLREERYSTQGM